MHAVAASHRLDNWDNMLQRLLCAVNIHAEAIMTLLPSYLYRCRFIALTPQTYAYVCLSIMKARQPYVNAAILHPSYCLKNVKRQGNSVPELQCAQNPIPIGVGYLAQYIVKPLLGYGIAKVCFHSHIDDTGLGLTSIG